MNNHSVAWSINTNNRFSLIYPDYQGPPFLGESHLVDISLAASDIVYVLRNSDGLNTIEYSKQIR
ncbi:hypothetical protein FNH22_29120 [Fulvivirga sp. M361]|uniref:hypothetical protein n=1 Tax=Fulvivirga sp. M361 TaxID=2594266 RepID=UPI00117B24AC|nr:hypothetical protein [Fulvivirga sp. M361]TRX48380.1 hypothetical protein FNH22_29120 [Fulvivirga sp. M361]